MRRIRMTTAKWVRGSVRDRTSSSAHLSCLTIGMILTALHQNRNPVLLQQKIIMHIPPYPFRLGFCPHRCRKSHVKLFDLEVLHMIWPAEKKNIRPEK